MTRSRWAVVALTTGALALAGCNAGSSTTGTSASPDGSASAKTGGAITIGLVAEPASLDFTQADGAAAPQLELTNIYETLVKLDNTGEIVPSLAKSWKVSDDKLTYTFTLVDNATFTDGAKFTAKDAAFSINRVKTGWVPSVKAAMDVVSDAKAVSDTELQVTLSKPSNNWLYKMTTRIGAMMSEAGIADLANKPVGTGPYVFSSWNRGDSIELKANASYWGKKPNFDTVTFKYFKDPTALNNALLTGAINVVGTVQAPESLGQFESAGKYQIIEGTTNGEVLLSMNNSRAPFNNLKARQAVRTAIDHKALMDTCWAGKGALIGSMVPPTDPWYEDRTGDYPFDLAKAKSLLQESGMAGTPIQMKLPANLPYATACGQVVKSMLEEAGFTVNLSQLEFPAAWLQTVFKDADYDMSMVAHVEPRDLPAVFGNPKYYPRYDNAKVQELIAAADSGTAEEEVTKMKEAAKIISEDAAGDFLFVLPNLMVADTDITGLPKNAIGESFDLSQLGRS